MWSVNGQFYLEVMKRLREAVQRKRPEGWRNKTWMLHHNHALAHTLFLIREFLVKHIMTVIPQPSHSPDLAPADFPPSPPVPKLKSTVKGRQFQMIEEIEEILLRDLRAISQNTFQDGFQNWKKRWEWCINSGGEYFEGDKAY
jgi:hypothetical protein